MGRKPLGRKSEGLGDRHRRIMEFLINFQEQHGYSPSIREIGKYINVESTSLVDYYLEQLAQEAYIERDKRVSRSIRVLRSMNTNGGGSARVSQVLRDAAQRTSELLTIPVWGRIGASLPVPAPSAPSAWLPPAQGAGGTDAVSGSGCQPPPSAR